MKVIGPLIHTSDQAMTQCLDGTWAPRNEIMPHR